MDQGRRLGGKPGLSPRFDPVAYRRRTVVDSCFARLKQFRALATCYEKRAATYRALMVLAALKLWLFA